MATILIAIPLTVTTVDTVKAHEILESAQVVANEWVAGTDATVLRTDFDGDALVFVVEGRDDLPGSDLTKALGGEVPSGTVVVVNQVGGERLELGRVP